MRCRTCDYPLWRTTRRHCPECGTAFRPSEYRFEPAAVLFRCPHCSEGYYGTGRDGQLEPSHFDCASCGMAIETDQMSLEPAPGVDEALTGPPPNPWATRQQRGMIRAWFQSSLAILGAPSAFIGGLPANTPVSESVLFAGITATLGAVIGLLFAAVVLLSKLFLSGRFANAGQYIFLQSTLALTNIAFTIVSALLAGLVAHGVLKLLRGTSGGLGRSMPAILYAYGATGALNLLIVCPCVSVIAPIWWCVAMSRMLQAVHRVSTAKTITASIIAAITWMSAIGVGAWASASLLGQPFGFAPKVRLALPGFESGGGGLSKNDLGYATPLEAVVDDALTMHELIGIIAPDDEPFDIGGLDAEALNDASDATLRTLSARIAEVLPPANAPYRLGRAIFTYRNAPPGPSAWLVVVLPKTPRDPNAEWTLIRRTSTVTITGDRLAAQIAAENKRRSEANLPALPDLAAMPDLLVTRRLAPDAEHRTDPPAGTLPPTAPPSAPPAPPAPPALQPPASPGA